MTDVQAKRLFITGSGYRISKMHAIEARLASIKKKIECLEMVQALNGDRLSWLDMEYLKTLRHKSRKLLAKMNNC